MKSPRPTSSERLVHAVPKPSGKASSSKGDKAAPIKRTNLPDTVSCPVCSPGIQDGATCTVCNGTGRISATRARHLAPPRTTDAP